MSWTTEMPDAPPANRRSPAFLASYIFNYEPIIHIKWTDHCNPNESSSDAKTFTLNRTQPNENVFHLNLYPSKRCQCHYNLCTVPRPPHTHNAGRPKDKQWPGVTVWLSPPSAATRPWLNFRLPVPYQVDMDRTALDRPTNTDGLMDSIVRLFSFR